MFVITIKQGVLGKKYQVTTDDISPSLPTPPFLESGRLPEVFQHAILTATFLRPDEFKRFGEDTILISPEQMRAIETELKDLQSQTHEDGEQTGGEPGESYDQWGSF